MDDWYDELIRRILDAQEEMLKCEVEANTVVLNGRKYGKLFKDGFRPTIFGLKAEVANLPDEWDFLVQYVEPEPLNRDSETLKKIFAIMRRLLLVPLDGLNPIPRKGTTKRECYRALWEIQELLGTNKSNLVQKDGDRDA